ncbi:E3 ubiquitin-protein ligase TRIM39-like isoform X26 [Brienomyrus brachyistius]|uniref:E3 ubiquitin-protein ligase TRIM39-like isoform X25 n=1 Tax=Brienomyrus brachyistius TaxID=42636 RepID=UPI0020B2B64D|nr:E3 ubiquitin-protein ligase TRIM39-like isoform X25 [Brienomyrus brachyistius]XP_048851169.1 E3 ubiquitin-protein ligase TRIM39-like isoform X26 [Brienomyrus brachyistius]XP_048851171.1 E3 ubiquitin-protein ligase TRIM39-like isoform X25 [Brienomyrus brachyistius]XP_048851172.1 E3 ubiquitin-protein ligase TRIM39-like isoform X25 [Brienomyrus brachyistius]XP_048851173.1 E3 ubiquitin-protein ligase TRIM39-like isoform X25 [Brienomyrus brachyistius]XP_048851174.1 E3 ubiquitin-protein ligase TR
MAAKASPMEEELCCSVCSDFYRDPVLLKCSHSFCGACLQKFWEQKSSRECPICKRKSSVNEPPLNMALRNIVDVYLKQKIECESTEKSESLCSLHGEKLLLFCVEDQEPICLVCQTAAKHRDHRVCPLLEAELDKKEDLRASLIPLKEKLEKFTKVKQDFEKTANHIKKQFHHTKKRINKEFEELHQFLREEEEARLAVLREEEVQKSQRMKEKIENISKQVSTLSEKIRDIEKAVNADDISFLKAIKDTKEKAQCSLQDPKLESGALIDLAKHLGSLKFRVLEKMLGTVQYTPVTLDPNTATTQLSVSDDLTSARRTGVKQQLPDNPERFTRYSMVLGSEGFDSGKHSWEVEVGDKPEWEVGVAAESVDRKGEITYSPKDGLWAVILRNGDKYKAGTSPPTPLTLERKPQRIRVQLDYEGGELSFINPTDMSVIYTFEDTFTGTLFPYLDTGMNRDGSNAGDMKICPVKVSVTSSQ